MIVYFCLKLFEGVVYLNFVTCDTDFVQACVLT